ncbi:MAG: multicopper oxidase domain-containing protein [Phycisphaerales bacterium]|nr:MAG: multicopper oxidase domain-containing protein [Phycisphaerales bacterium]
MNGFCLYLGGSRLRTLVAGLIGLALIPSAAIAQTGACCLPTGICVETTAANCATQGGAYQGNATTCAGTSCPIVLQPFVDALPLPAIAQPVTGQPGHAAHYEIAMRQTQQRLHRDLPLTTVWGYNGTYPGPTIEARRNEPNTVLWTNDLRDAAGNLLTTHHLVVDECLHGPDLNGSAPLTTVHLHGGHLRADSDGMPDFSYPPGQSAPLYTYPNNQPAATIWYHDHGLGITRLNVYMGLAGFYLIRDDAEDALNIPRGENEIALAIQDRAFNPDGSFKYPAVHQENFFGDFMLVNGKVWPYHNVKRGKYRFRLLNGCNSRTLTLALSDNATFWQIGTDMGLLPAPVAINSLTISPGERADVVINFASYAPGTEIILENSAPAPFPGSPGVGVIPNVMKFIVGSDAGDTDPLPTTLASVPVIPEAEATVTREFLLRKTPVTIGACDNVTQSIWTINGLMWDDIVERPVLGTTEIWTWINRSGMTHPMHMHLVAFQILDRQPFQMQAGQIVPTGPRVPPIMNERGWKDTVQVHPFEIVRVIARFEDYAGLFPYHCHILEHEDHEMMRQFEAICPPLTIESTPDDLQVCKGAQAQFAVQASGAYLSYQWKKNGVPLLDGPTGTGSTVTGAKAATLTIDNVALLDVARYECTIKDPCDETRTYHADLVYCPADLDDATQTGACDGAVTIDDLLYFIDRFQDGDAIADLDDGSGTGVGDYAVTIDDLLFYIERFADGC